MAGHTWTPLERAAEYIRTVPGAAQGERNATAYRLGQTLLNDFALDESEALPLVEEWNNRCSPPLDEQELRSACCNGKRYAKRPVGNLLNPVAQPHRQSDNGLEQTPDSADSGAQSGSVHRDSTPTRSRSAPQNKVTRKALVKRLADAISVDNCFAQDAGGKLYRYSGGTFKRGGEEYIRRRVKQLCLDWCSTDHWSSTLASEVVEFLRVDAPHLWERPPEDCINVANGILRVADRVLLPHSPDFLSPVQLPVGYDKDATCPAIDKFIDAVFPADARDLAYEIAAWLMRPETSIQKAILLLGPGGNGKSVFLRLVVAFLGMGNTSALSLHKLESDKFAAARLIGKLANICPDLPTEHLSGTSVFKAITGGDPIAAEYKFKDSFDFTPYARLVFSANQPPRSQDSSQGFFDRWVVIPFDRSFRGTSEEIPSKVLDARLQSPSELSGLLNKALDSLRRLEDRCGFTMPRSVQAAGRDFQATTDPLAVWLDRYTVDGPDAIVVRSNLRIAFNAYLERQGKPTMTEKAFGLAFGKLRPHVEAKQRTFVGKVQWVYVGLGLLLDDPPGSQPSHGSQGSQGSHTCSLSHARGDVQLPEQDRGNPVNAVNAVDDGGQCNHVHVDETPTSDGYINRQGRGCGENLWYRRATVTSGTETAVQEEAERD